VGAIVATAANAFGGNVPRGNRSMALRTTPV
jgi:hypothetical protein